MLKKIRIFSAALCFIAITALFLDFTGTVHAWIGWLAKIQFLPAVFALNFAVIVALVALTLIFGRVYCSVLCPLGVLQDVISFIAGTRKKNRFSYSPALHWLRYGVLAVFCAAFVAGAGSFVALLAPYSSYGRMVSSILSPLYKLGNNALAYLAERADSYTFYSVDVWMKSAGTLVVAVVTLAVIGFFAWRNGRTYCNTVCPVGTVLGFLSRFSLFKLRIDTSKCISCGLCAKNCKAACINSKGHEIDYSRCVACMNCIGKCHKNAISYTWRKAPNGDASASSSPRKSSEKVDNKKSVPAKNSTGTVSKTLSRKRFFSVAGLFAFTSALRAQDKTVDGGLAFIADKKVPARTTPIKPPGARSLHDFATHCTACQLCVSVCPNNVLRPSSDLATFMQPESSYERGYCRPECTKCADVCPAGAILPITKEEKSSTQIGHAVWIKENCVIFRDEVSCGACARHCPAGAIQMVKLDPKNPNSTSVPAVNSELCVGCGACENLCPARPFSAIYVEGHEVHREI